MTTSTQNQTLRFLMQRFGEAGLRPDTRHGQHFLIDLNLLRLLCQSARLSQNDVVLEVGTGLGSLTGRMAEQVAAVVTVEVDRRLSRLAGEELSSLANVTLLEQDALRNKNSLSESVLDAVRRRMAEGSGRVFKLVANLPYHIATPVLANLLTCEPTPASMTVTIQKELADRISARPSTKDYGALSVWVQSQCDIELVRVLPPTVFWPRPKVTSAIIHVEVRGDLRHRIGDLAYFHNFLRTVFQHRRKYLRSALEHSLDQKLRKAEADTILQRLAIASDTRAEQLDAEALLELARAVREAATPSQSLVQSTDVGDDEVDASTMLGDAAIT